MFWFQELDVWLNRLDASEEVFSFLNILHILSFYVEIMIRV